MIDLIFYFGNEIVFIRVQGASITFSSSQFGDRGSTIDGLKLSKQGVVKEFPDLENDECWHSKAIERFKEKLKAMKGEKEIVAYLIADLKKFGYQPKFMQEAGFRKRKIE